MNNILLIPKLNLRRDPDVFLYKEPKTPMFTSKDGKYINHPVPPRSNNRSLPTINRRRLGGIFIDQCDILDYNWRDLKDGANEIQQQEMQHLSVGKRIVLLDLYLDACEDIREYNEDSDFLGFCNLLQAQQRIEEVRAVFRELPKAEFKLGDEVDSIRRSSDDLEAVYGEPKEDRCGRPWEQETDQSLYNNYWFGSYDPERYDGDPRWRALTDRDYEVIYDGGRWVKEEGQWVEISVREHFGQR